MEWINSTNYYQANQFHPHDFTASPMLKIVKNDQKSRKIAFLTHSGFIQKPKNVISSPSYAQPQAYQKIFRPQEEIFLI